MFPLQQCSLYGLALWNILAAMAHSTPQLFISSPNAWYSSVQGQIHLVAQSSEPIVGKMWFNNNQHGGDRIVLCLDHSIVKTCSSMPCETGLLALEQGEHLVQATIADQTSGCISEDDHACFACRDGEHLADLHFVVEPSHQSWTTSTENTRPTEKVSWRDFVGDDLWPQIRRQEDAEYHARPRINPLEMGLGTSCAGHSVCGVWVDPTDSTNCADLCTSTSFLPSSLHNLQPERQRSASAELRLRLLHRQFPPSDPDLLALRSAAAPISGFGVTMVYVAHNFAKAFAAGAVFAPARDSLRLWTSERYCGAERHAGCYFEAVTNVSAQLVDHLGRPLSLPAEREQEVAGIDGIMHDFGVEGFRDLGSFWLQALALDFLWRPNPRARAYILHLQNQRPLRHPAIAMHVRRGDSHLAGRWMPSLETYLRAAETMRAKYGVSTIFLATDDTETAQQCMQLTSFNCSSLPIGRELYDVGASEAPEHNPQESAYDKWVETRIQHGEVDASEAAMHAIAEIETLGHCDFFVGRLDSAISRMALMLMFARHGPRPYISLDKPWAQPPFGIIN